MSKDEFVTIEVVFKTCTSKAVLVVYENEEEWLPRSLLAWSSDKEIDSLERGTEFGLKLYEWKANQLGWS